MLSPTAFRAPIPRVASTAPSRAEALEAALIEARGYIADDLTILLHSYGIAGDRATIDANDEPHVERAERLLAQIDAALGAP